MSWNRGGGGRRRHRDDYERREPVETPQDRLRASILRLGEVDPLEELPRLEQYIRDFQPPNIQFVAETLRIGVTEQPFKIPHYAALLRQLHDQPTGETSLGRDILEEIWKGFQTYVDQLSWRETRLCIHFFGHLTLAHVISVDSFTALIQSFTAVLDEFGVSLGRAKRASLCAGEGLIIAGSVLPPPTVSSILAAIDTFNESTASAKSLTNPSSNLSGSSSTSEENADELIDSLLSACRALAETDFAEPPFPRPYASLAELDAVPFTLPSVLVPPEAIEGLTTEIEEDAPVKKEEWPEFFIRLFDNEVTPDFKTPVGYVIRTDIMAILDIFEVNRKECARLLLEYPKWTLPGTFKPKPGAPIEADPVLGKDWQLESTVIETILGAFFLVPESPLVSIYYMGVITELCKLSPTTVGPAVGKSIRKLYGYLGDGLDVEAARRFAEWFSIHMSNFGFQWVWKEWLPDLSLDIQHPRRMFMRRAIKYEIRLAYYDRIAKTLPEPMQAPEGYTLPKEAPGPVFAYEDPINPHHESAQSILTLFRGRSKAEEAIAHLETMKTNVEASDAGANSESVVLSIVVQSLLNIGSRSFSHLLNAIERYLPLLRHLVNHGQPEAKSDILTAVASFWRENSQMIVIVFDKLMQYQIVDPTDVVGWVFERGVDETQWKAEDVELNSKWCVGELQWHAIKGALDKANGRVNMSRKKVTALRKEDDDARAQAIAKEGAEMAVDGETQQTDIPENENPVLATAIKAFASLVREQKACLSRALEGFVACLAPSDKDIVRPAVTGDAWANRESWGKDEWSVWESWGWYRHFCRVYSPYLRTYATTLGTVSFARFEVEDGRKAEGELLRKVFDQAIGAD